MENLQTLDSTLNQQDNNNGFQFLIDLELYSSLKPETTKRQILDLVKKTPACRFLVYQLIAKHKDNDDHEDDSIKGNPKVRESTGVLKKDAFKLTAEVEQIGKEISDEEDFKGHPKLKLISDGQIVHLSDCGVEIFFTRFIKEVTYHLCDDSFSTCELLLTPRQILTKKFGDKADQYYLKQIIGKDQISYEGKPDEEITMCPDLKFVYIFTGPMTVS